MKNSTDNSKATAKPLRGPDGKFVKGTKPGPGRPTREAEISTALQEGEYLRAYRRSVPLEQFNSIVDRLVGLCSHKQPSVAIRAMGLLFQYLLPLPQTRQQIEATLGHNLYSQTFRVAGKSVEEVYDGVLSDVADVLGDGGLQRVMLRYVERVRLENADSEPPPEPTKEPPKVTPPATRPTNGHYLLTPPTDS